MAGSPTQFQVGHEKVGGRKRGSLNRKTLDLQARLAANGIDPLALLANVLPTLDPAKQADICVKMLDFIYPKRKAMELQPEPDRREFIAAELAEQRALVNELKEINEKWQKK